VIRTRARKPRAPSHPGTQSAGLRRDVQEAIDRVWPDGIVELSFDSDESYFCGVQKKLSRAFHRLRNARLVCEREADGEPAWWDQSDPDEDPPDEIERSRSYHLFFVSPEGKAFTFETEAEGFSAPELVTKEFEEAGCGEEPPANQIPGTGRTGWLVAVSLLAPLAVIELGEVVAFEDGSTTEAEIEPSVETADGQPINLEDLFQKTTGARAYKSLVSLRARISAILEKYGIAVLPADEWRKPVPWLRAGEDTLIGIEGRVIRVLDAFFFEEL
jgi:hypothetical protein